MKFIKYDGYDEAFLGLVERSGSKIVSAYSFDRMVEINMKRDGMDPSEAAEFVNYNIIGGYLGDDTPFILHEMTIKEAEEFVNE
jgi:hypothetical protein